MLKHLTKRLTFNWLRKFPSFKNPKEMASEKRSMSEDEAEKEGSKKKQKSEASTDKKRKCAIMFGYNGKGYYGLQRNPGFLSIEEDLCKALMDAGLIPLEHFDCMQKMSFQRAARTDKGVSAAGNLVSLKENLVEEINSHLPAQIRVFDCFRTTQSFNSKNYCDARTYIYVLPTYAFLHKDQDLTLDFKMDEELLKRANSVLEMYKGTHNFHNYTSGLAAAEKRAKRFIIDFKCGSPFVRNGIEFCEISVKGQSFMLHQIRKIVGTVIAVLKGYIGEDFIEESFSHSKIPEYRGFGRHFVEKERLLIALPKAPGLGLVLDKLHYHQYNKRYGGSHITIDFDRIKDRTEKFKEEAILSTIYKTEVEEYSMLKWLPELEMFPWVPDNDTKENAYLENYEKLVKLKEKRTEATYKLIYGPDYQPPAASQQDQSDMAMHSPGSDFNSSPTNQETVCDTLTNENGAKEMPDMTTTADENTDQLISKTRQSDNEAEKCEEVK